MNILFLHSTFPGQFRHVATALAQDPNHQVVFATDSDQKCPNFIRFG